SSSLGYFNFDSTDEDSDYNDLNGKTTIVAQAVNAAVSRGVVCVTAAGNNGPLSGTIISPGDADSVITVGAVLTDGVTPAKFTSRGPRSDSKRKPDVAAQGVQVISASAQNPIGYIEANGTSLATPLISGSVALILSVFPEMKPYEVRHMLYKCGSQSTSPDDTLGYGIPDLLKGLLLQGIILTTPLTYPVLNYQRISAGVKSSANIKNVHLYLSFAGSGNYLQYPMYKSFSTDIFSADVPLQRFGFQSVFAYIIAEDNKSTRRYPYDSTKYFEINPNEKRIPCGIDFAELTDIAKTSGTTYIYPSIVSRNDKYVNLVLQLKKKSSTIINIFNSIGQLLSSVDLPEREEGIISFPLDISKLPIGVYFVQVHLTDSIENTKFMIGD
ncbi:MAG: S8 family serine peptidase, partial [Bacteroidota bacterium]